MDNIKIIAESCIILNINNFGGRRKLRAKILVVDDEAAVRESLQEILILDGYDVELAESGESAINAVRTAEYDLLLLDIRMPGMSGIDVLRQVNQLSPETKVIMLTAHGTVETAIEALRHGAHDYILKPVTAQSILSSVARGLAYQVEKQQKKLLLKQLESSLKRLKDAEGINYVSDASQPSIELENGIVFDALRRDIWRGNQHISLTPTENKLLVFLVENRGRVLTHRELVYSVQGYDVSEWEAPEVIRPLISRLRRKLGKFPGAEKWVINIRGTGYLFDFTPAA